MNLPDQSPPVQRGMDQARGSLASDSSQGHVDISAMEAAYGVSPAGYQKCYGLPDPAQSMCLLGYGIG